MSFVFAVTVLTSNCPYKHDQCASAKGLIASSSLVIRYRTGDEIILSATRANLVDPAEKIDVIEAPNGLDWVLIVEKDVSVILSHMS